VGIEVSVLRRPLKSELMVIWLIFRSINSTRIAGRWFALSMIRKGASRTRAGLKTILAETKKD